MLRFLKRAALVLLVALALIVLPSAWLRGFTPHEGPLPTLTYTPTPDTLGDAYQHGLALAAQQPLEALPQLEEVMLSEHPQAEQARLLARAIQAARLADNQAYLYTATAQALAALGHWDLAQQALLQAVLADPDYAEAWAYLGEARYQNGADPWDALQRALELNPRSVAVQLFHALYQQRWGNFTQADSHFAFAAQLDPENPAIYVQWGQGAMLAGDPLAARQHFEQAAGLTPNDPQVWLALARYSLDSELYVEQLGLPAAMEAHRLAGSQPEVLLLLGRAYILKGDRAVGLRFLQQAVRADAGYAPAHLYLGLFYLADEEIAAALAAFNQVIDLAAGSPEAIWARELILQYSQ